MVILKQNGTLSEVHIVIIKRDLHNLEEVSVMMQKYRQDNRSYEDMKVFEY